MGHTDDAREMMQEFLIGELHDDDKAELEEDDLGSEGDVKDVGGDEQGYSGGEEEEDDLGEREDVGEEDVEGGDEEGDSGGEEKGGTGGDDKGGDEIVRRGGDEMGLKNKRSEKQR